MAAEQWYAGEIGRKLCNIITFVSGRQGNISGLASALQLGELVADDAQRGGLVEHGLVDQH